MTLNTWLFLYLAGLVELVLRYRISFDRGLASYIILIPVLALAVPRPRIDFKIDPRVLSAVGGLLALCCAIVFARQLSLDFWDTRRIDLAWLTAGIGVGGLLAVRADSFSIEWRAANWLIVGLGWLLALWIPVAPLLAIAPAASLSLWQRRETPLEEVVGLSPAWLLFWIGMALPKSWWDSNDLGALSTGLWALGVAATHLPKIRDVRLPLPLLSIALVPLLYVWLPIWIWSPLLGSLSGWALQRSSWPRDLARHRARHWAVGYALLGGLLLSYGIHSNLQLFGWLVWAAR